MEPRSPGRRDKMAEGEPAVPRATPPPPAVTAFGLPCATAVPGRASAYRLLRAAAVLQDGRRGFRRGNRHARRDHHVDRARWRPACNRNGQNSAELFTIRQNARLAGSSRSCECRNDDATFRAQWNPCAAFRA
jgi:hypothetical protein